MGGFLKKSAFIMLCVLVLSGGSLKGMKVNAASKEMNIYAMYLKTDSKGDSVLLESKGEYLLMDIGSYVHADAIIEQLKSLNITKIDIYFSHLHMDHVGGGSGNYLAGLQKIVNAGISIEKLYLPAKELAPKSVDYPAKYKRLEKFMEENGDIIYLKVGDTLQIGDINGKIIGPLNVDKMHPDDFLGLAASDEGDNEGEAKYTYYENNCSLAAMFTCGNVKFFTAGDALKEEAEYLAKKYGTGLQANIMKLSHHGTGSGNVESLLDLVSPQYTFASNTGLTGVLQTKKWRTNMARKNATKHGMCYLIGNQKKTIIYQVKDDVIKMYTGKIASTTMLKGWVKLVGGDGEFRKIDMYYLDKNGVPVKGVQKIGSKYYYFGAGGCMEYGNYDAKGKYQYWKSYGSKRRYFTFSDDKQYAIMARGFQKVGSTLYYFDKNGFKVEGKKKTELKKIGNYYYGVGKSGSVVKNKWATINKEKYYFDKKGRMVTDKKIKIASNYYYFGKDGKMVRAKTGTKIVKIGKHKYGVGKSGTIVISNWGLVGKNRYYFGKNGIMVTNKRIKIAKNYYYFGQDGKMVRNKKVKIGKASYYFGAGGQMYRNRYIVVNGKDYFCQGDGKVKLCK